MPDRQGDLRQFFDANTKGRVIHKWLHYFEIYERHFSRFRGTDVCLLEIGVFRGGSLDMWRDYFGPKAKIFGVDVDPSCLKLQRPDNTIIIGDQASAQFWRTTLKQIPAPDIVIDDGGHYARQQIASLEALLPVLQPGGVYLCEDVHGRRSDFTAYICNLVDKFNECKGYSTCPCNPMQSAIASLHFYPFVVAIEKRENPFKYLNQELRGDPVS